LGYSEKKKLRVEGLKVRHAAFLKYKDTGYAKVGAYNFMQWLGNAGSYKVIAAYFSIKSEFQTQALLHALFFEGKRVCLPVISKKNDPLVFRKWTPETRLKKHLFDIPSPLSEEEELTPDLVISPLVSYDRHGVRLGYGGGFYDRTLGNLRKKGNVLHLGLAFSEQKICGNIPKEIHDIPLDGIVTIGGVYEFK
jgi:5-formyltetrahydrofolate cyclo-ligase